MTRERERERPANIANQEGEGVQRERQTDRECMPTSQSKPDKRRELGTETETEGETDKWVTVRLETEETGEGLLN